MEYNFQTGARPDGMRNWRLWGCCRNGIPASEPDKDLQILGGVTSGKDSRWPWASNQTGMVGQSLQKKI
jgi:hypothetical protein